MRRRRFLETSAGAGLVGLAGLAGCLGGREGSGTDTPTTGTTTTPGGTDAPGTAGPDLPYGVYVQSFTEDMYVAGTAEAGDFAFGLMFAAPHVFWNVNGREVSKTPIEEADSLHLMSLVWDPETGTALPETGLSVEIERDGDLVSEEVIYPMLSQAMGFHYGANFALPGDGTYAATLEVGGVQLRRTGDFRERFGQPTSASVEFAFTEETRAQVSTSPVEQYGERGALEPVDMGGMPQAYAPEKGDLPGTVLGETTTGDATLVVTRLASPPAGVDADGPYLAVSARTPYNRLVLPAMALSGTLTRNGEPVFEGAFRRTLDPALGYHYGAAVDGVESGDRLRLEVTTPPQVARHEGYERAFLEMPPVELTL